MDVSLEVNVTELLSVAAALPPSAERDEMLRARFLEALSSADFAPIRGASEFVFSPTAPRPSKQQLQQQQEQDHPDVPERPSTLPPAVAPPPSAVATWDEDSLLTLKEIEVFGAGSGFPCFLRLVLEQVDRSNPNVPRVVDQQCVSSIPLGQTPSSKLTYVLKLSCLTLPPYRIRGGDVTTKSRMRRLPDLAEAHSPLRTMMQISDLPAKLQTAMNRARQKVEDFVSSQIADLLRFAPLTEPRRLLLVRALHSLARTGSSLVVREQWAPRLCRDSGPQLVKQMLPGIAASALQMRELFPGGAVAEWREDEGKENTHWLLLEAAEDGGMQALLFVGTLSDEEQRNRLREANVKVEELVFFFFFFFFFVSRNLKVWEPLLKAVNQMSLLRELHETRSCPALLDAPEGSSEVFSGKDARFGGAGSLACDQQGDEIMLPLHPRCTWEQVRRFLARTLQLFAVDDRPNLFVYHESGQ
jgi:hypothetical protein